MSVSLLRPAVGVLLFASVVAGGAATAAPKPAPKPAAQPSCNLMLDDKGDAKFAGNGPNDPNLDITSADVASDAKTVTTVLRLASFATTDPQSPLGRGYYVLFNAPGSDFPVYFNMQITPDLTRFAWGDLEKLATGNGSYVKKGDATGVIDTAKGEIRISVPVSEVKAVANVAPGSKLTSINAAATAVLGTSKTPGLVSTVDSATSNSAYIAGSPSCVVPGK
jgi:hypothetical protein